jgi:hypothetical protein
VSTICADCGVNAWDQWDESQGRNAHEDFYVHNELWDAACPDDLLEEFRVGDEVVGRNGRYVLCIGCFEQRLGRQLRRDDFTYLTPDDGFWRDMVGRPASTRFRARLASGMQS